MKSCGLGLGIVLGDGCGWFEREGVEEGKPAAMLAIGAESWIWDCWAVAAWVAASAAARAVRIFEVGRVGS